MATCKDCLHFEACEFISQIQEEFMNDFFNEQGKEISVKFGLPNAEKCPHFKYRSRFVELPCAEWIEDEDMYGDPIYRCSNCNEHFVLAEGTPTDNCYFHCPNCGAKMDEHALKERGQCNNTD